MKIIRSARLWFREGSSDKVYEVDLIENDALASDQRYLVNFRYGRRGANLREGSKTSSPVVLSAAIKVFDSVVVSKTNDGYRRTDVAMDLPPTSPQEPDDITSGRDEELLARLSARVASPWQAKDLDRLIWRIGELRLSAAADNLLKLAERQGAEQASYSLVWALVRVAGHKAVRVLSKIADRSTSTATRDLALFALSLPSMVDESDTGITTDIPPGIREAVASYSADALTGAITGLAGRDPPAVGPTLCALYRLSQANRQLHSVLAAVIVRLPARPPYLIGLRRLFKQAEMIDDALIFAATAHRFEIASPMYRRNAYGPQSWVPELQKYVNIERVAGRPDAGIGLSHATLHYFKRRIWRSLRKRGEEGDSAFAPLAAAFLLAFHPDDLPQPVTRSRWVRDQNNRWRTENRTFGPFSRNWTASQLLWRNDPGTRFAYSSLTSEHGGDSNVEVRGEAFPELWDARPDLALELACESVCAPVSRFGVKLLKAAPNFLSSATATVLARLLQAHDIAAQGLGLAEARERLAKGDADPALLAALIAAHTPDARKLAVSRIEATTSLPWSDADLGFAVLLSVDDDVDEPVRRWARERVPDPAIVSALVMRLVSWLQQRPAFCDDRTERQLRMLRTRLVIFGDSGPVAVPQEAISTLMDHGSPGVVAVGIELLALSGMDVSTISNETWENLLGSSSVDVQTAALRLFGRLDDETLGGHTPLVMAFATAASHDLRIAARPLVRRLALRDAELAEKLFNRLVDSLFQSAPDEAWPQDAVDLLYEAMPERVSELDNGTLWRLLQARAKGAQLLGSTELSNRSPDGFSVRQIARLGNHPHVAARNWVKAAYIADPARFQADAEDAVLLVESDWPEIQSFADDYFSRWPADAWSPQTLAVVTDSVKPEVLALARRLLRSSLSPQDAPAQLMRLLEHPAQSMHLLVTELLMADGVVSPAAFGKLLPLARIVMLQVHKGRIAKDRMSAFLHSEALRDKERAELVAPLFSDLSISGVARDRSAAILALRDISVAHPGIETPLVRRGAVERIGR